MQLVMVSATVLMCYEGKELKGIYWDSKKSFFDIYKET